MFDFVRIVDFCQKCLIFFQIVYFVKIVYLSDYLFLSGLSNFFLNVILVRIVQFYPIFKFVQFYSKLSNLSACLFLSGLSNFVPTPKYSLLSETSSLPDCRILFRISVRILRIFEFCPKCYFFRYFFFFQNHFTFCGELAERAQHIQPSQC